MKYFGTDGIRRDGNWFLTAQFLSRFAYALKSFGADKIVIGRDTRVTGAEIEKELANQLMNLGVDVTLLGIVPTPEVCYFANQNKMIGVIISASHNPPCYNGLKIVNKFGCKLEQNEEELLEFYLDNFKTIEPKKKGELKEVDGRSDYLSIIKNMNLNVSGVKVLLDCGYGATSKLAKKVFEELGCVVDTISDDYQGEFINVKCGATNLDNIKNHNNYDIAFSYDGDGDRVIAKATNGEVLDGDNLLYVLAKHLNVKDVVITVMSNLGLEKALKKININPIRVGVGDKFVQDYINKFGLSLGAEQSGHIITNKCVSTGDGILSSLKVVEAMKELNIKSKDIKSLYDEYPQIQFSVPGNEEMLQKFDFSNIEKQINGKGRFLVRASGTEPIIRVLVECKSKITVKIFANQIHNIINGKSV